jgi:hypothetical protein
MQGRFRWPRVPGHAGQRGLHRGRNLARDAHGDRDTWRRRNLHAGSGLRRLDRSGCRDRCRHGRRRPGNRRPRYRRSRYRRPRYRRSRYRRPRYRRSRYRRPGYRYGRQQPGPGGTRSGLWRQQRLGR